MCRKLIALWEQIRMRGKMAKDLGPHERVRDYLKKWKECGYPDDIPDEVPEELAKSGFVPSYKAICVAILKNDLQFHSLGFPQKQTEWYGIIKRIEIERRNTNGS